MTRLELRRVRIHAGLSEETIAFTADLYLDGVKRGQVANEGTGGANRFTDRDACAELETWATTQPPVRMGGGAELALDADFAISLEVGRIQELRDAQRLAKRVAKNRRNAVHAYIVVGATPDGRSIAAFPSATPTMPNGYRLIQVFTAAGAPA